MSIDALIERVANAKEDDREIDWELAQAFDPELAQRVQNTYEGHKAECIRNGLWPKRKGACWRDALFVVPRYTGSMDAAIALVEKKLPNGTWWINSDCDHHAQAEARVWTKEWDDEADKGFIAYGKTPPLALCLALLRSLSDRGRT